MGVGKTYIGSSATDHANRRPCHFLIRSVDAIGSPDGRGEGWYTADAGWKALDAAVDDFGFCEIVESVVA
jgi:hypothetical protein